MRVVDFKVGCLVLWLCFFAEFLNCMCTNPAGSVCQFRITIKTVAKLQNLGWSSSKAKPTLSRLQPSETSFKFFDSKDSFVQPVLIKN